MKLLVLALCIFGVVNATIKAKRATFQYAPQPIPYAAQQYVAQPLTFATKQVVTQSVPIVTKQFITQSSPVVTKQYVSQPLPVATKQVYEPTKYKYVAILSQNAETNYDGNFRYGFQSEDGTSQEAVGTFDPKTQIQVVQGRYSYTAPDGTPIEATWTADEGGFHIEGAHLPTPPPIPDAILRSLEYIRSLPPSKEDEAEYKKYNP